MLRTIGIKGMAKALRQALNDRKIDMSHSDCLELIAKQFGMKDWNVLSAALGQDTADRPLVFSVVDEDKKLHKTTQRLEVNDTDLSGSRFSDANLSGTWFDQINFSGATFNDSNMSGWRVHAANLSGAQFQNINLSGVTFSDCRIAGVTIDGIPLEDMIAAHKKPQAD